MASLWIGWGDSAREDTSGYGGIGAKTHAVPVDSDKALCGYKPWAFEFGCELTEAVGEVGCLRCRKSMQVAAGRRAKRNAKRVM